jgi:hypothetical protein
VLSARPKPDLERSPVEDIAFFGAVAKALH